MVEKEEVYRSRIPSKLLRSIGFNASNTSPRRKVEPSFISKDMSRGVPRETGFGEESILVMAGYGKRARPQSSTLCNANLIAIHPLKRNVNNQASNDIPNPCALPTNGIAPIVQSSPVFNSSLRAIVPSN